MDFSKYEKQNIDATNVEIRTGVSTLCPRNVIKAGPLFCAGLHTGIEVKKCLQFFENYSICQRISVEGNFYHFKSPRNKIGNFFRCSVITEHFFGPFSYTRSIMADLNW